MSVLDPANEHAAARTEASPHAPGRPVMPQTPPALRARRKLPFSKSDIIVFLLAANMIGLVGLGIRVYRGDKPTVVTVGITQLARDYMGRLATSNVTPDQARLRTQMFLSVVQDTVRTAATKKGMIVMPRECVLAGEYSDLTADVSKAVNETMQRVNAGVPAGPAPPAPATPLSMSAPSSMAPASPGLPSVAAPAQLPADGGAYAVP